MRHVDHQIRAKIVSDFAKPAKIDDARIGRSAGDDHLRLVVRGQPLDFVHVDQMIVPAHAVRYRLKPPAGQIDRRAVGQVAAGGQIEPHERVAWLHQRHEDFGVGGSSRVWLHVGERAAEQLFRPVDGDLLGDVDELAAAVIALAG